MATVARIRKDSNGARFTFSQHPILLAAISHFGWGSKANFIGRYRYVELPSGGPVWTGEVEFLGEARIGESPVLRTPFGDLEPIYPLDRRVLFMPKVYRS